MRANMQQLRLVFKKVFNNTPTTSVITVLVITKEEHIMLSELDNWC